MMNSSRSCSDSIIAMTGEAAGWKFSCHGTGAPRTGASCAHAAPAHSNVTAAIRRQNHAQRLSRLVAAEPRRVGARGDYRPTGRDVMAELTVAFEPTK